MVAEVVQNYVDVVSGLSKMTRAKAMNAAKLLLAQAGLDDVAADASERVSKLAEEILAASRANRELLEHTVSAEIDKAATRWGFARAEDLDALRDEVAALRATVARTAAAAQSSAAADPGPTGPSPARKAAGEKTTAAKKAGASKTPTAAKKSPPAAKKSAAKKAAAKKAPAKRAAAKKTTGTSGE